MELREYKVKVKVVLKDPRMAHIPKDEIADVLMDLYVGHVNDISFEGAGKGAPIRFLVVSDSPPEALKQYDSIGVQDSTYSAEVVSVEDMGRAEV